MSQLKHSEFFNELLEVNKKPEPFEFYSADKLWTIGHIAGKMLGYHLDETVDAASRNKEFITRSASWIINEFNLCEGTSVIDFGCGPGLYTTLFAKTGASVTGIDFSKNSLTYAEKVANENKLNVNYIYGNYLDYNIVGKFDLITMIMCDFTVLNPSQRKDLLHKFCTLLKPNSCRIGLCRKSLQSRLN